MNKRDLAKAIAVHADVNFKTTAAVLDALTEVVTAVVAQGEPVVITGFAKFVKVNRAARMGRNPATGESIRIKASKKARISAAKTFKDAVLSPALAPKLARGSWPISEDAVRGAGKTEAVAAPARAAAPKRATAKKKPARRPAAKKATVAKRRPAAKKATAKRAVAKKATAKRAVAKKTTAKRAVAKKTTAKRTVKKATVAKRRPAVKKTTAKRSVAKKATAARRPAARKTTARR